MNAIELAMENYREDQLRDYLKSTEPAEDIIDMTDFNFDSEREDNI